MTYLDKSLIRKEILKKRKSLSFSERKVKSLFIQERVIEFVLNRKVRKLLSYINCYSEVETDFINKSFLKQGFELGVPRVNGGEIDFFGISNLEDDIEKGSFGISEPKRELHPIQYNNIGLAIIPGVAFSFEGSRIGYGKGYYDIFLSEHPTIIRIALGFECQIVKNIPLEGHDQIMDFLITEKKIYDCSKKY